MDIRSAGTKRLDCSGRPRMAESAPVSAEVAKADRIRRRHPSHNKAAGSGHRVSACRGRAKVPVDTKEDGVECRVVGDKAHDAAGRRRNGRHSRSQRY